jgi:hypothetical protein
MLNGTHESLHGVPNHSSRDTCIRPRHHAIRCVPAGKRSLIIAPERANAPESGGVTVNGPQISGEQFRAEDSSSGRY